MLSTPFVAEELRVPVADWISFAWTDGSGMTFSLAWQTLGDLAQSASMLAQGAGDAAPAAPGAGAGNGGAGGVDPNAPVGPLQLIVGNPLFLFGGLFFLFYVMVLLPERRKQKETERKRAALKKNDRVVTTGGIFGTVVSASSDSEEVTIRVDESTNTRLRVLRSSIGAVLDSDKDAPAS